MGVESNRHKLETSVAKVPVSFSNEARGFKSCCEPFQVLFDAVDTVSWKNDKNSAWGKGETVTFVLKKNGVVTSYTPISVAFPNETDAYYTTVPWRDVFATDGLGCYSLYVTSEYAGLESTKLWATYDLQPYNIGSYILARGTVRLLSIFNDVNTVEGINFTGAFVQDTLRIKGKFGYWQLNTEVDNVVFQDNEKDKVKREELTVYDLRVDLHGECIIEKLRMHLLAENACWITDHNADNYSYKYLDYPVIVKEGFDPTWIDGTRQVKGIAKFEDKQKRAKTHFQDENNPGDFAPPPSISFVGLDGYVENSNATYTATVPSGQTVVLPDIEYRIIVDGILVRTVYGPTLD